MKSGSQHKDLLLPLLGHAVLFCLLAAVFTAAVAAVYGLLASFSGGHLVGVSGFLPSGSAWEASVLLGVALALFNATGDSVEIDCDQERKSHSAMTYGLALATTCLIALAFERISHGTWLQPYFHTWLGAAVVGAFLVTKLVALRWHRKALLTPPRQ